MIEDSPEGDAARFVAHLQTQCSFILLKSAEPAGINDSLESLKHPLSVPHTGSASKVLSATVIDHAHYLKQ